MRRVLKPGGALGLIWNVRDERVDWVARITALIAPYEGDAPRFGSGRWRDAFPAPGFSELKERRFPHAHVGPPERVIVERTLSTSSSPRWAKPRGRRSLRACAKSSRRRPTSPGAKP